MGTLMSQLRAVEELKDPIVRPLLFMLLIVIVNF